MDEQYRLNTLLKRESAYNMKRWLWLCPVCQDRHYEHDVVSKLICNNCDTEFPCLEGAASDTDKIRFWQTLTWNMSERAYKLCGWRSHRMGETAYKDVALTVVFWQPDYYANMRRNNRVFNKVAP
jgi:uncharacterized CHY-type Zn-finger protein